MSWQTCFLRVSARWPVSFKRIPALPEMLVRGVRRSWEMERSRSARSCWVRALAASSSRIRLKRSFSIAMAHSPRMAWIRLSSKSSGAEPEKRTPMIP